MDFDVIIIGAGHNGLVAASYLARAGYRVAVFERRHVAGGLAVTEEYIPGYRSDAGAVVHAQLRLTPVIEDLGLTGHGLSFVEFDPMFNVPLPGGNAFQIYRDVDRTAASIERCFPGEGMAYRRFIADWTPFSEMVRDLVLTPPGAYHVGKQFFFGRSSSLPWRTWLQRLVRPYGHVIQDYFRNEQVQAALLWLTAQWGPPPSEPASGWCLAMHPLFHQCGLARPVGGFGALTRALQQQIELHRGQIILDSPVTDIICNGTQAVAVQVHGRRYSARAIISAVHALETFDHLLPEQHRPPGRVNVRVSNGLGVLLHVALKRQVTYAGANPDARRAIQLLCRAPRQLDAAYGAFLGGKSPDDPPLLAMVPSAVDSTLAPDGHDILMLWSQYHPHKLSNGSSWDEVEERVAEQLLTQFEAFAPGTRGAVVHSLLHHPEWLERELGLYRGQVMHLDMSVDQLFAMRPFMGMSEYRTHLRGLYVSGASTHPGGGFLGAAGRNAARAVLTDLDKRRV